METHWNLGGQRSRHTCVAFVVIEQVLEVYPALLEACGINIGQIVGSDINIALLGSHTGSCSVKRSHHKASTRYKKIIPGAEKY